MDICVPWLCDRCLSQIVHSCRTVLSNNTCSLGSRVLLLRQCDTHELSYTYTAMQKADLTFATFNKSWLNSSIKTRKSVQRCLYHHTNSSNQMFRITGYVFTILVHVHCLLSLVEDCIHKPVTLSNAISWPDIANVKGNELVNCTHKHATSQLHITLTAKKGKHVSWF